MIMIKSLAELHYFYADGRSGRPSGDEEDKVPARTGIKRTRKARWESPSLLAT